MAKPTPVRSHRARTRTAHRADAAPPLSDPRRSGLARSGRPTSHPSRLPVSGAWRPGDDPGRRRFLHLPGSRPFALEGGGVLRGVDVAYETWGELDADGSNAVLVCHALTGDSHVAGPSGHGHPTAGWWDDLVGPGRAIDTDRWFVVCANVLGGCQGTTGPASIDPDTGRPHGARFPVVTIRDVVRTQAALADHLGVDVWASVIGGSMGGMQALEWTVMFPDRMRSVGALATTAAAGAQQIAWSHVGRMAIAGDPNWRDGDYYDAPDGEGPHQGLALARSIAQIHYRTEPVFEERFGRRTVEPVDRLSLWDRFQVESYLDYQGEKLVRRFDANSYLVLNKAMDLHDLGRGRGGVERALDRVRVPVLTMSIDSDSLYPPYQQEQLRDGFAERGRLFDHVSIASPHGHDGFLLEPAQVGPPLARLLDEVTARG
ncbi:homoserine O-acetyltransferase MetX [Actinomarinicola tropica]|uniref:Homoserine O-acetyltransferase n=1 Tax=Actinomarinicola tropica TaxID=2789776 RepID=A0A5Q2RKW1_9ACTN|nr:homoserine O-acetyltransferase [Actinomarinicola tropica]QGG95066.1 homoserine O-acetyltransferase [Actinomarinicola tropica]